MLAQTGFLPGEIQNSSIQPRKKFHKFEFSCGTFSRGRAGGVDRYGLIISSLEGSRRGKKVLSQQQRNPRTVLGRGKKKELAKYVTTDLS